MISFDESDILDTYFIARVPTAEERDDTGRQAQYSPIPKNDSGADDTPVVRSGTQTIPPGKRSTLSLPTYAGLHPRFDRDKRSHLRLASRFFRRHKELAESTGRRPELLCTLVRIAGLSIALEFLECLRDGWLEVPVVGCLHDRERIGELAGITSEPDAEATATFSCGFLSAFLVCFSDRFDPVRKYPDRCCELFIAEPAQRADKEQGSQLREDLPWPISFFGSRARVIAFGIWLNQR